MLKDDRHRSFCPVRRVVREEGRNLIILVAILVTLVLLKIL